MKQIIILPPEIAQKIAAGEVVERPVSVVKELVENSVDAGASEIKVELRAGGKKQIKVQDNGQGMCREDALLCFERHSTSKISKEEDLWGVKTLGFRGEALASIAAVSRLTLKTCDGIEEKGTQVERERNELIQVQDIGFPQGTSVEVSDLFFNLPVRQKFLRSEQSELALIVKYLTLVGLAYPEIRLLLIHGQREILNCPPVRSLRERIFQLYGKTQLEKLMEVNFEERGHRIFGFSTRPPLGRLDKTQQLFFVNKRPVRDRVLQSALNQAYRGYLEKDHFAEAFLFLVLPMTDVDVNVHPAKAEIRFRDSQAVFRLVLKSVEHARLKEIGIKEVYSLPIQERGLSRDEKMFAQPSKVSEEQKLFETVKFQKFAGEKSSPRVLGQYLESYIIAEGEEGILIIDQHNAHERVLFEKYKEIDNQRKWPQTLSLVPLLCELSPSQISSFEANQEFLKEAGFVVEAMGQRSFALNEFPGLFKPEEAQAIFLSLLEEMKDEKIESKKERLLATLACKTAVKAGQLLALEKMEYLVEKLFQTSNPSLCPHGRPVLIKVSRSQIEKDLRRPRIGDKN